MLLIETFRNAIGELALPAYSTIIERNTQGLITDPDFWTLTNIGLIWFNFFVQTYFMQIIMLNFMIAMIMTTYEKVTNGNLQVVINYKTKANLNQEVFLLLSYLPWIYEM